MVGREKQSVRIVDVRSMSTTGDDDIHIDEYGRHWKKAKDSDFGSTIHTVGKKYNNIIEID